MVLSRLACTSTLLLTIGGAFACVPKSEVGVLVTVPDASAPAYSTTARRPQRSGPAAPVERSLASHFADSFSLGVALEPQYLNDWGSLVPSTFARITAENAMKCAHIHPSPDRYNFVPADQLADFARHHGMHMTGHTLVWHRDTPSWLVQGSAEEVAAKLQAHIATVVARYADVTDNWDVVNEAISDTPGRLYRNKAEGAVLHAAIGEGYIEDAFRFAAAAVESSGSNIDLYYNDYNMAKPEKLAKALKLAKGLRDQGIRIDGIGAQAHWNLTWPSTSEIQRMFDTIAEAGFKAKISELDISIYPHDDWDNQVWEKERVFDESLARAQAARYKEIFELFVKNGQRISSVTFWGLTDDRTWLDSMPQPGRDNHPLLFDDLDRPKPAYFTLFEVSSPSPSSQVVSSE